MSAAVSETSDPSRNPSGPSGITPIKSRRRGGTSPGPSSPGTLGGSEHPATTPTMNLSDGYGDLSPVEQALVEKDFQYRSLARKVTDSPDLMDDVAQEARIAAWLEYDKVGIRHDYAYHRAQQRAVQHAYRDQWFGSPQGVAGKPLDPIRRKPSQRDSLDDPDLDVHLAAAGVIDAVMLAYHDGEIAEAINALAPDHREYVVLRFWGGLSNQEIAARQGKAASYLSSAWVKVIRPRLLERLDHLAVA